MERDDQIIALREEGLTLREIGEQFGITYERVRQIVNQKNRAANERAIAMRAERAAALRVCRCGGEKSSYAETCQTCHFAKGPSKWPKEKVIAAMLRWTQEHGRPPSARDWLKAPIPDWCPYTQTVQMHFGSWNAGIAAAGLEPVKPGVRRT